MFIGTLHGKPGRFSTDYTFDGAYAKGFCQSFDASLEVGGGCIHKIERGSGAFRNVEGVIKIIDVIAGVTGDPVTGAFAAGTGGNNFLYYARLHLDRDVSQALAIGVPHVSSYFCTVLLEVRMSSCNRATQEPTSSVHR